jgi:predicted GNAT family acetyltransferase
VSDLLRTRCVCGWESTGSEDDVVAATLDHGLRVHNMAGTREEVLERAERVAPEAPEPPAGESATDPTALAIVDAPERRRFEALIGADMVGFSQYKLDGGTITFLHTEINPDMEGRGFGSRLAAGVLDAARSRGLSIVVACPFISAYVRRHQARYPEIDLDAGRAGSTTAG